MPRSGSYLGDSLGSRDPAHLARWQAALMAGFAKRQCSSTAKSTGVRCRSHPLKFSDRCSLHCRGAERIAVDQLRLVWLRRKLRRRLNDRERSRLEARVAKIERRRLRWVWKADPTVEGSTIALQPYALERAHAWLRDIAGVEPSVLTARAYDRCLWASALCLSRRYHKQTALLEVKRALQAEEQWRTKTGQAA
jgi:hypothetical protein